MPRKLIEHGITIGRFEPSHGIRPTITTSNENASRGVSVRVSKREDGSVRLKNEYSMNAPKLNGLDVLNQVELKHGDFLKLGDLQFKVNLGPTENSLEDANSGQKYQFDPSKNQPIGNGGRRGMNAISIVHNSIDHFHGRINEMDGKLCYIPETKTKDADQHWSDGKWSHVGEPKLKHGDKIEYANLKMNVDLEKEELDISATDGDVQVNPDLPTFLNSRRDKYQTKLAPYSVFHESNEGVSSKHGYKLRVTAGDNASSVLEHVLPILEKRGLKHKFVDLWHFEGLKNHPESNTYGKFITIYSNNLEEVAQTAVEIDNALSVKGLNHGRRSRDKRERKLDSCESGMLSARYGLHQMESELENSWTDPKTGQTRSNSQQQHDRMDELEARIRRLKQKR